MPQTEEWYIVNLLYWIKKEQRAVRKKRRLLEQAKADGFSENAVTIMLGKAVFRDMKSRGLQQAP